MKAKEINETKYIVYGVHAVTESLLANTGNKLYIQEDLRGKHVDHIKDLATSKKVPISWTKKKALTEMTAGAVHQGFVLRVSAFAYTELDELLELAQQEDNPLLLILDGLTDPHNFGSILRTADATGVCGVIIPKHRAVGVTPVVAKTSTGAVEHVPIARVTNLSQALDQLKANGFWVFGTDVTGTPSYKWNTSGKLALIIGNEGKGISANIKKQVDEMITIPMMGHVQSLNASVAAAILMYEVFRNKLQMKKRLLLVDGYNMIAFWESTRQFFKTNQLDQARRILLNKLNNYAHFDDSDIICVFDAQYVPGLRQRYDQYRISVIFTEEEETADSYIERTAAELNTALTMVEVATSDLNEQWTIFSQGALRVTAKELEQRVNAVKSDLDKLSQDIDLKKPRLGPFDQGQLNQLKDFMDRLDD